MIAQLYQPVRPIEVGNRHVRPGVVSLRCTSHCDLMLRIARHRISTFPSLVGSIESRLVVGNCQTPRQYASQHRATHRCASRSYATQRIPLSSPIVLRGLFGWLATDFASLGALSQRSVSRDLAFHLNEHQTQQQPHSCGYWWACPAATFTQHSAALRCALLRCASLRISTNCATQRRRPSGRVRWVSHQPPQPCVAQRAAAPRFATHLISTNTLPSAGHLRVACGSQAPHCWTKISPHGTSPRRVPFRPATLRAAPHLNGRP